MPRLPPSLFCTASKRHPFLPLLLPELRNVGSAKTELRWLMDYLDSRLPPPGSIPLYKNWLNGTSAIGFDYSYDNKNKPARAIFRERSGNGQERIHLTNGKNHPTFSVKQYENLRWQNLKLLCLRRGIDSEPIQYITGFAPFGHLSIPCQKGVLIPRQDTHDIFYHMSYLLLRNVSPGDKRKGLRILDLCTGTGAIPLLLASLLVKDGRIEEEEEGVKKRFFEGFEKVRVCGVDVDGRAVRLANANVRRFIQDTTTKHEEENHRSMIKISRGDVFDLVECNGNEGGQALLKKIGDFFQQGESEVTEGERTDASVVDIVTANPPYISPKLFKTACTGRAVRIWEPKRALIPPHEAETPLKHFCTTLPSMEEHKQADTFYPKISCIARHILKAKALVVEIGDKEQAERVRQILVKDWLSGAIVKNAKSNVVKGNRGGGVAVWRDFGTGGERAVVAWRNIGNTSRGEMKEWEFLADDLPIEGGSFWNNEVGVGREKGGMKMVWMGTEDLRYEAAKSAWKAEKRRKSDTSCE